MFLTDEVIEKYAMNEMKKLKVICFPILIKIGGISEIDYDDFYSIANETLWMAANNFDESKHDNFDVFLKGCIARRFKTEMTKRNREKRISRKNIDSLDQPIGVDGDITWKDVIESDFDIDNQIDELSNNENVIRYIQSLTPKQKQIAQLVIDGYDIRDIRLMLNMSEEKFENCLGRMKTFDKRILLK